MWNLLLVMIVSALSLAVVLGLRHADAQLVNPKRAAGSAGSRPAAPPRDDGRTAWAWEGTVPVPRSLAGEALTDRLRDRYIAARFPGLMSGAEDLGRTDHVIRCARLFFEDEKCDLAHELLSMAVAHHPADEALRLAQLEIAFLMRQGDRFVALAHAFRTAVPDSRNWSEISRLGRAMAPDETMFAAGPGSRPHEHYGPWPDLPNWIRASWDLTAEVLAADFRRAMLRDRPDAKQQQAALGAS